MSRNLRFAIGIAGAVAAALLLSAPAGAATDRPPADGADDLKPAVELVEVPAPAPAPAVTGNADEAAKMLAAAALGAALGGAAADLRVRRRPSPASSATAATIDITESVDNRR